MCGAQIAIRTRLLDHPVLPHSGGSVDLPLGHSVVDPILRQDLATQIRAPERARRSRHPSGRWSVSDE